MNTTATAAAIAVIDAYALSPEEPQAAEQQPAAPLRAAGAAAAVFVAYSFAAAAWRVRYGTPELAFVASAGALLAALFLCIRRAEGLTPGSPPGERRLVQAAVWVLSAVLSCAFAYRVAAVMPPALAGLVWCMTAPVVLTGFYLLVLCKVEDKALPSPTRRRRQRCRRRRQQGSGRRPQ